MNSDIMPVNGNSLILLIDDSHVALAGMRRLLEGAGYHLLCAQSGEEGLTLIRQRGLPYLALVDQEMPPRMTGLQFCEQVRQFSDIPLLLLVSAEQLPLPTYSSDWIDGYILRPSEPQHFLKAVQQALQKGGEYAYPLQMWTKIDDQLRLNIPLRLAELGDRQISLTPLEAKLLFILLKNAQRTVNSHYLIRRLWPQDRAQEDRLHAHVYRLRKKLERDPKHPTYLLSDWGNGYRFAPSPQRDG